MSSFHTVRAAEMTNPAALFVCRSKEREIMGKQSTPEYKNMPIYASSRHAMLL